MVTGRGSLRRDQRVEPRGQHPALRCGRCCAFQGDVPGADRERGLVHRLHFFAGHQTDSRVETYRPDRVVDEPPHLWRRSFIREAPRVLQPGVDHDEDHEIHEFEAQSGIVVRLLDALGDASQSVGSSGDCAGGTDLDALDLEGNALLGTSWRHDHDVEIAFEVPPIAAPLDGRLDAVLAIKPCVDAVRAVEHRMPTAQHEAHEVGLGVVANGTVKEIHEP